MFAIPDPIRRAVPLAALVLLATPAAAQDLPEPVRAMVEAAIATGDAAKVAAVAEAARTTNPDAVEEIDGLVAAFTAERERIAAEKAADEKRALREAGVFARWSGEGQLGGFRATGNADQLGLTAGAKLEREGIDWTHKLALLADYQENNGVAAREQYRATYEPNYRVDDWVFLYGLAQFESDRFQGYDARYSVSGGAGLTLLDEKDLQLSVKGGPAWRRTERVDGTARERISALAALDFDWQVAERLKLFEDASVFYEPEGTTLAARTGLEAGLGSSLSARFSYAVEYETDPLVGAVSTDTLTRFTLIYGF